MKLAIIDTIEKIQEHPNADSLILVKLKNWHQVIMKKEDGLQNGDRVLHIRPDTILSDDAYFMKEKLHFLDKQKYRIKNIRLRGEISNGIALPIDDELVEILNEMLYYEDCDISELLGIKKYEKPIADNSQSAGAFPNEIIQKTDELNIESFDENELLSFLNDKIVYVSKKHDGSSITIINDEYKGFMVCSRNQKIKESDDSKFWIPVKKYNLKKLLPVGIAIQAELVGPKIQKNPEKLVHIDLRVFNVFDIKNNYYYNFDIFVKFCNFIQIPTVELYYNGQFNKIATSKQDMIDIAQDVKYKNGNMAEGLVWRTDPNVYYPTIYKNFSAKTLNYNYDT